MVKRIVLFWILVITAVQLVSIEEAKPENNDEEKFLKEVMSEAEYFSHKIDDIPYYEAFKSNGLVFKRKKIIGVIFHTIDACPEERGMIGPIDVLVRMDMEGKITGMKVLSHKETPGIGSKIELPSFLDQFKGKSLSDRFMVGEDIHAITGATISSQAVARIVKKSLLAVASQLNIFEKVERESQFEVMVRNISQSALPAFFFLSLLAILGFTFKVKWLRNLTLLFGLCYLGFMKKAYLSFITFFNIMLGRLTPLSDYIHWYLLIALIFIMAIVWGRIYCGWICPFGAIQEFLNRLPFKKSLSPKADRLLKYLKYFLLLIIITGLLITKDVSFGNYEPFATIFTFSGIPFHWVFLILVLISSFFLSRPFCRYLCLIGAIQALISRWSLFKSRLNKECDNCGVCVKGCPTGAISWDLKKVEINQFECIRCNRCTVVCPRGVKEEEKR